MVSPHSSLAASFVNTIGPDLIILAIIAIVIGVPIAVALFLNRRFQQRNPNKRPYRWGYYFSIESFVGAIGLALNFAKDPELGIVPAIICGAIYTVLAWFFARRHHWAWITLTILSCNPVAWIINFIYLRKRWAEDSVATPTI
jgi:ABC-type Fe3+-siderophore transport system permease subunit